MGSLKCRVLDVQPTSLTQDWDQSTPWNEGLSQLQEAGQATYGNSNSHFSGRENETQKVQEYAWLHQVMTFS